MRPSGIVLGGLNGDGAGRPGMGFISSCAAEDCQDEAEEGAEGSSPGCIVPAFVGRLAAAEHREEGEQEERAKENDTQGIGEHVAKQQHAHRDKQYQPYTIVDGVSHAQDFVVI